VRLVDGTKVRLHAVIDNFSRRILAWRVAERFEISNAVAILDEAVCNPVSREDRPTVMADGGIENFNGEVDALVGDGLLSRVRALVDVRFSNAMIESWWSKLKHHLHRLETAAAVRRHVAFYVAEYNATIPHAAFSGQTPDEIYFGRGEAIPAKLEAGRDAAREAIEGQPGSLVRAMPRSLRERGGRGRLTRLEFAGRKAWPVSGPFGIRHQRETGERHPVGRSLRLEAELPSESCRLPVRLRLPCRVLAQKVPDDDENLLGRLPRHEPYSYHRRVWSSYCSMSRLLRIGGSHLRLCESSEASPLRPRLPQDARHGR